MNIEDKTKLENYSIFDYYNPTKNLMPIYGLRPMP